MVPSTCTCDNFITDKPRSIVTCHRYYGTQGTIDVSLRSPGSTNGLSSERAVWRVEAKKPTPKQMHVAELNRLRRRAGGY